MPRAISAPVSADLPFYAHCPGPGARAQGPGARRLLLVTQRPAAARQSRAGEGDGPRGSAVV